MAPSPNHVLLVDDDQDQRELTTEALREQHPTVRVSEAGDASLALKMLEVSGPPDLVILDYSLPGMTGLEALREIKRRRPELPVIMVTGQGDETIAVEAMKNGAYDYIVKSRNYHQALPVIIAKVIQESRLRRELEEASLRGRRLFELSFDMAKEQKVEDLTRLLVEGAADLIGVESSFLYFIAGQREVAAARACGAAVDGSAKVGPLHRLGLLSEPYLTRRPLVIEEPQSHPLWSATPWRHDQVRHMLAVPLTSQGAVEGVLCLFNKRNGMPFTAGDLDTLSTLAVHAGMAIDNARFVEKMSRQAVTDSLTGLANHMEFQKQLGEEVDRARRYRNQLSLLMLDLDHFKMINDTYGHQTGDAVLIKIGQLLRECLRSMDQVFRYGGEEFAVILPETPEAGARIIAERIRSAIADAGYSANDDPALTVTVSIGIAAFPDSGTQRETLIGAADQALFYAKRAGRNRIAVHREIIGALLEHSPIKLESYLNDPQMKMLKDLAAIIDAKSPYTQGHTEAVTQCAMRFADKLHLRDGERKMLEYASLLHNIGVVGIPNKLLNKQGPLTDEERRLINSHPTLAQMLIKQTEELSSILPIILYHHERYDGGGYPKGLKGEEIPYLARVLSVVDAYNAMISPRPYRRRLTREQAIAELKRHAGSQFDPQVTAAFLELLEQEQSGAA